MNEHETERMLVAFAGHEYTVLEASGVAIESDIDGLGTRNDVFSVSETNAPDHGLWVWEGVPKATHYGDNDLEFNGYDYSQFNGCDYSHGTWRQPSDEEWAKLKAGEDLWPSKLQKQYDPSGGGGSFRSDLPYGQGGGGD